MIGMQCDLVNEKETNKNSMGLRIKHTWVRIQIQSTITVIKILETDFSSLKILLNWRGGIMLNRDNYT